jgi:hypothetical protein
MASQATSPTGTHNKSTPKPHAITTQKHHRETPIISLSISTMAKQQGNKQPQPQQQEEEEEEEQQQQPEEEEPLIIHSSSVVDAIAHYYPHDGDTGSKITVKSLSGAKITVEMPVWLEDYR